MAENKIQETILKKLIFLISIIISLHFLLPHHLVIACVNSDSLIIQRLDSLDQEMKDVKNHTNYIKLLNESMVIKLDKEFLKYKFYKYPLISILISLMLGIIASICTLTVTFLFNENRLRKKFKYLEGEYYHFVDQQKKESSTTKISYKSGGKLLFQSNTPYGKWEALLLMDKNSKSHGGGIFNYENKSEGGFLHILVKDMDNIYTFPYTLTHTSQKINFYILKRKK